MCIQEYMHMHMQVPLSSGSVAPLIIHSLAYLCYLFGNTFMLVIKFIMLVGGCTNFLRSFTRSCFLLSPAVDSQ